jgi:3-dehydroquinate dehydratase II
MAKSVLLINGPNLSLLGTREPHIYGYSTLADVENGAKSQAERLGITVATFQSNYEGAIIDRIHQAGADKVEAIVINPAAFTHTSVAIRDALCGVSIPFVEIHVSNVHKREPWRHHSYFSDKAAGVIMGMGVYGYTAAIDFVATQLKLNQ